jgi:putative transposase
MCRVLKVHRSGYYAWLAKPQSKREIEDSRLLEYIRQSWIDSDGIYGSPRIFMDLRSQGETCGKNRVARIMKKHRIKSLSVRKKPRFCSGKASILSDNHLNRDFEATKPNEKWVTDITYIKTYEGFLFLCVVIDLYSRRVIGWSMKDRMKTELVLDALLMAVWRRSPISEVVIHTDQGSQFGSDDWIRFCDQHNLKRSMSRKGNCYDNAVVESFFSSLKKERIRKRVYKNRDQARSDIFEYIEQFYNRERRHGYLDNLSPVDFESKRSAS